MFWFHSLVAECQALRNGSRCWNINDQWDQIRLKGKWRFIVFWWNESGGSLFLSPQTVWSMTVFLYTSKSAIYIATYGTHTSLIYQCAYCKYTVDSHIALWWPKHLATTWVKSWGGGRVVGQRRTYSAILWMWPLARCSIEATRHGDLREGRHPRPDAPRPARPPILSLL